MVFYKGHLRGAFLFFGRRLFFLRGDFLFLDGDFLFLGGDFLFLDGDFFFLDGDFVFKQMATCRALFQ